MKKTPTLTVGYHGFTDAGSEHYIVQRITDSLTYRPGERISKGNLEKLCASPSWKVIVIDGRRA